MGKKEMILALIEHYSHGNKAQFAYFLGISPQGLSTWIKRGTFDVELLFSKCKEISPSWLLTGDGEMLLTPDSKESEEREEQVPMGDAKQTKAAAREDDFLQIVKSQQETIASLQADLHRLIDKLLDDE